MEGMVPTNFDNEDYPRPWAAAARLRRFGNDIDKMYSKDENCASDYRLKIAATILFISALLLKTLAGCSPSVLKFIPLADVE